MTHDDDDLRAVFTNLRAADGRDAPPFARVLGRERSTPDARAPIAWLAAAAVLLVGAGLGWWAIEADRYAVPREVTALVAWRPMTDALLDTPGRALLRGQPRLITSTLDVWRGGTTR